MAKNEYKDVHTMIGADAVIQGNINCQGGVAIYGKVFGDVTSEGPVRVARGGEVHGNVQAAESQIGGTVDGNVRVESRAVLGAESQLKGDLIYRTLVIEEGAQFQGHCVLAGSEPIVESEYQQDPPQVEPAQVEGREVLQVAVKDPVLGVELGLDADLVVLAAAVVPRADSGDISQMFNVGLGPDGFFKEAHVKLRPVEFATEGVYLCGTAHYPKYIPETIKQAYGAAGRVLTLLSNDTVTVSGSVCEVEADRCMGCGACADACAYGAIELRRTKQGTKAVVNPVLCKGDGLCNAKCPTGAIVLKHFTDEELLSQIDAACGAA